MCLGGVYKKSQKLHSKKGHISDERFLAKNERRAVVTVILYMGGKTVVAPLSICVSNAAPPAPLPFIS